MTDSDGCGLDIFSTLKGAEVRTDCSLIWEFIATQSASVFVQVVLVVYMYGFSRRSANSAAAEAQKMRCTPTGGITS